MPNHPKYTGEDMLTVFILGLTLPTFLIVLGVFALRSL